MFPTAMIRYKDESQVSFGVPLLSRITIMQPYVKTTNRFGKYPHLKTMIESSK